MHWHKHGIIKPLEKLTILPQILNPLQSCFLYSQENIYMSIETKGCNRISKSNDEKVKIKKQKRVPNFSKWPKIHKDVMPQAYSLNKHKPTAKTQICASLLGLFRKNKHDTHISQKGISIDTPAQKNGQQESFISEVQNSKQIIHKIYNKIAGISRK